MTIVATATSLVNEQSAVRLARYAQIIGYPECNFFGVNADIDTGFQCQEIWTKTQRDMVAKYLAEAQEEIEQETGYFLAPRWIGQGQTEKWQDWQSLKWQLTTKWSLFIEAGIQATSTIQAGAVVNHATDPAVIGPIATTVTNIDEVKIFHPGTDVEIDPSAITIAGGFVTINIPRCRMVTAAVADNPVTGLAYTDLANFEATVDVKRVYNSTAVQATFVYPHSCGGLSCDCDCTEQTAVGCIYVRNKRLGIINVMQTGQVSGLCGGCPEIVRLNYRAGMDKLTFQAEDAIIRLAHAKMPSEPCGCDVAKRLWGRDRNIPEVLTRERLNCPFGLPDGAWVAYKFAHAMKIFRGSNL